MKGWEEILDLGLEVLVWWDLVVKPGIRKLAIMRSKHLNKEKRGELNILLLRQAYLARKLQLGNYRVLGELRGVQSEIERWYQKESEKVLIQSKSDEIILNERSEFIIMSCTKSI